DRSGGVIGHDLHGVVGVYHDEPAALAPCLAPLFVVVGAVLHVHSRDPGQHIGVGQGGEHGPRVVVVDGVDRAVVRCRLGPRHLLGHVHVSGHQTTPARSATRTIFPSSRASAVPRCPSRCSIAPSAVTATSSSSSITSSTVCVCPLRGF